MTDKYIYQIITELHSANIFSIGTSLISENGKDFMRTSYDNIGDPLSECLINTSLIFFFKYAIDCIYSLILKFHFHFCSSSF